MSGLLELLCGPEGPHINAVSATDDEDARERYRAYLAERGDERAELIAIETALLRDDFTERDTAIARAKEILSKGRVVREWWALVTRTAPIRNCGSGPEAPRPVRFAYECPRTWESLSPTDDGGARHCSTCARLVYLCRSREEAEERARRGECITISASSWARVSREFTSTCTGRPDPIAMWSDRVFPGEGGDP